MHASCAAAAAPVAVPRVDAVLALVIVLLDVEAGCVTRSLSCLCAPFSGAHSLSAFLVDCAAAVAEAVAAAPPLTPRAVRGMSSSTLHVCARGSGRGRERKREGEKERGEGESEHRGKKCAKNKSYILTKKPYFLTNEPCIWSKEHQIIGETP